MADESESLPAGGLLWRYARTYFRRTEDATGTPVQNCTIQLKASPDQYDGGREYGGIGKSG
ncbi:hypothetical protein KCP76_24650 [Salmonella enterica subsp. enterica serovar Weltevreden]|nr:hypothetical protein KCP76_24650 [Salmonella enterica subsp. enterica serovar Weltevreden]